MPEELHSEFALSEPAPRQKWSAFQLIVIGTLALMLLATGLQFYFLRSTDSYQAEAEQRGYRNRAAVCEIQRDLGVKLDKVCLDPEVIAYYDPAAVHTANGAAIRRMVCQVMVKFGVSSPTRNVDCAGTGV